MDGDVSWRHEKPPITQPVQYTLSKRYPLLHYRLRPALSPTWDSRPAVGSSSSGALGSCQHEPWHFLHQLRLARWGDLEAAYIKSLKQHKLQLPFTIITKCWGLHLSFWRCWEKVQLWSPVANLASWATCYQTLVGNQVLKVIATLTAQKGMPRRLLTDLSSTIVRLLWCCVRWSQQKQKRVLGWFKGRW